MRRSYAVRLGVPAECRGGRPRHRDCRTDSPEVSGLPLLHDGLPVSCPVFQLVGSAVAEGNRSASQSGCCPAHARCRREVQLLPRAAPHGTDKSGGGRQTDIAPGDYIPACAESCPARAIVFGDLADESSEVSRLSRSNEAFQFLPKLGTAPKLFYTSSKEWVRNMAGKVPTT